MMTEAVKQQTEDVEVPAFDVDSVRAQFPILTETVKNKPLVYLDSAASSQKPVAVIDAIADYYRHSHANVHRGVHTLSERATDAYEGARQRVCEFVNAASTSEIVFVRGASEAINLVANSFGAAFVKAGDCVLVTEMEHHSNIVPWQMLCQCNNARLLVAPMLNNGELDLDAYRNLLQSSPKIVAMTHVSNALGTVNPVRQLTEWAHDAGAYVLIDGAQAAPHMPIDVRVIDCDFYVFSGHKCYAPTGIGALYGCETLLEQMPPWQGGGEMIREVTFEHTEYNVLPFKFEAGTPNISGAVGLHAAIDFMYDIGLDSINEHERALLELASLRAAERPWLRVIGTAGDKAGVLSFVVDGVHSNDIGMMLDADGFAVRTGHHCAMPVMQHYQLPGTIRASLGVYNTHQEIDNLFSSLDRIRDLFV